MDVDVDEDVSFRGFVAVDGVLLIIADIVDLSFLFFSQ